MLLTSLEVCDIPIKESHMNVCWAELFEEKEDVHDCYVKEVVEKCFILLLDFVEILICIYSSLAHEYVKELR